MMHGTLHQLAGQGLSSDEGHDYEADTGLMG